MLLNRAESAFAQIEPGSILQLTCLSLAQETFQANHGTAFASRHKLARERVEAMKVIWTESKSEYRGEFVNFRPMMAWPKPVQRPHPPIIVGGAFPHGARRALRYGNGWMPHRSRTPVRRRAGPAAEVPRDGVRSGAGIGVDADHDLGAKENLDLLKRDRDDGVSRLVVSLWIPARPIRSCRNSTAGRR
jgi:alkanesulfonate monooxygenase SsuD/methylene tetrahydromethanopterin reductase-like flavin-dependent oxidoreductase (luciferase family)